MPLLPPEFVEPHPPCGGRGAWRNLQAAISQTREQEGAQAPAELDAESHGRTKEGVPTSDPAAISRQSPGGNQHMEMNMDV